MAQTLKFEDEIDNLMCGDGDGSTSFTALLGLPPIQAVELLHCPPSNSPTFPSNSVLIERAARLSVNAGEVSPKPEPPDCWDHLPVAAGDGTSSAGKRKHGGRSKEVKGGGRKRSKSAEEDTGGEGKQYVYVRARRGQATDSHSLAERARREKINVRMKLLQEIVPGCSKITGTASVLDEIINHVQSLQRQVEFLSMSIAAVNPGIDTFLSPEYGVVAAMNERSGEQPLSWTEGLSVVAGPIRRQQALQVDAVRKHRHQKQEQEPTLEWERGADEDDTTPQALAPPAATLFGYGSAASVSLPNLLKTEL